MIYLDFAKAFDTVPHQRLLSKLKSYGVSGDALGWIQDFLSNRRQKVVVNGSSSNWAPVLSGIPQGSVLGPALFVCYINDMPEVVSSMIKLFADDTKLYSKIASEEDHQQLQTDLNNLKDWANTWQLRFNASKCKTMHLGRCNKKQPYSMNENGQSITLGETICEKDLGVFVDNGLKFNSHAETAVNKANKIVGMIRRSFDFLDPVTFVLLFKSLVRPHLEYGNVVWSPLYKKDVLLLENVQRRATKMIPGLSDLPYEDRLRTLKLPSLVYRRLRGDLIEAFKYTHNMYDVNREHLLPSDVGDRTRGNSYKLTKQRFCSDTRKRFFSIRVNKHWNSLPDHIVTAPTLNAFKGRIDKHYRENLYTIQFPISPIRTQSVKQVNETQVQEESENLLQAY